MIENNRFTYSENILHDNGCKKTIKLETTEDAKLLCNILNELDYKAKLFDEINEVTLKYLKKINGWKND